jgi:hypothetical protein
MKKYILYINQNYSFEILRPLQIVIKERGHDCIWYVGSKKVDTSKFHENEVFTQDINEIANYPARAVFAPGNEVPSFLRGLKVQIFHGLEWKKKGHFRIRDYFDVYCTHGPITTNKFNELAAKHQNFLVRETGWSKLDSLFTTEPLAVHTNKPVVLYAPTFSKELTSAPDYFDEIKRIVESGQYHWIIKFHPLMDQSLVDQYKSLSGNDCQIIESHSILPILKAADVMLSDTSSVVGEFQLLGKPVVTCRNSNPEASLFNITNTCELAENLSLTLDLSIEKKKAISRANNLLHPYVDGQSSMRILDTCEDIIESKTKAKKSRPLNLFRNYKLRRKLGYWKFNLHDCFCYF